MKLFYHYCPNGFGNCYILGSDTEGAAAGGAIIIDPGGMAVEMLDFIEKNRYELQGILITHDHRRHVQGLRTLKRIYDANIYAVNPAVRGYRTILVRNGDLVSVGAFRVEVISVPGHSADSAVFKVDRLLFTGDALSAGLVGRTASSYAAAIQLTALRSRLLSLPGDYTILPGHGPPSSLEAERRFNRGLHTPSVNRARRPVFVYEE